MRTIYIILALFLFSGNSYSQNGWVQVNSGTTKSLSKAFFINNNTGWICGDSGLVIKTTDKGFTWQSKSLLIRDKLNDIFFINENTGWVCGGYYETFGSPANKMFMAKTTNGGNNWYTLLSDSDWSNTLKFMYLINESSVLAFGTGSTGSGPTAVLRKTTNDGINWSSLPSAAMNSFKRDGTGTFWACERLWSDVGIDTAFIISSTNNGTNWISHKKFSKTNLSSLDILDDNTILVLKSEINSVFRNPILKSTNSGATWDSINTFSRVYSMDFINLNTGWLTGARISKTTNGGVNWSQQTDSGTYYFYYINMRDSLYGLAIANFSKIFITGTGGVVNTSELSYTVTDNFSLSQNYPNPFNPSTTINYELPITNFVSIKVFDVLGNEVKTLVNEKQNAGSYSVDFNAAELPSGIYFYKLVTEKFSETKKMILIK
ncbi:MAG: T9SS type A sorting domain-containing protein [Ignavibacteria bacterium]|nr:T9SS type A sorting domain-containing protein [Ignavibacteria bacterium]